MSVRGRKKFAGHARARLIRMATVGEALVLARMSRDLIELGLGWRWTPARITVAIRDPDHNVVVACVDDCLAGFGIMAYRDDTAHLCLLAVRPRHQRSGIGGDITRWLEQVAVTAGVMRVNLEVRASNAGAIAFYRRLGYQPVARSDGYYSGREAALRMSRRLRSEPVSPGQTD